MGSRHRVRVAKAIPEKDRVERECLRCGEKFVGDGRFNRLCPECNRKNKYFAEEYTTEALVEGW